MLKQRAHKQLSQPVLPRFVVLNPTLDLVGVVTSEHQVDVFRFGGQRAFTARSSRDRASVLALCWKFDGSELAIWWDDNTWQTLDAWSGQVGPILGFFPAEGESVQHLDYVSWQAKVIVPTSSSYTSTLSKGQSAVEQPLLNIRNGKVNGNIGLDNYGIDDVANDSNIDPGPEFTTEYLPKLLASFDATHELPRLSALPQTYDAHLDVHTKQALNLFSRQELLDKMKDSYKPESSNTMDLLLVGHSRAFVTLGQGYEYRLGTANLGTQPRSVCGCDSRQFAYCEALLTVTTPEEAGNPNTGERLELKFISLNSIKTSGVYLPIINQAVNQLSMLSSYITLSIVAVRDAWTNARDVFSRFMRNIEGTLSETPESNEPQIDIVTAMYRLATTGACPSAVVEWIVEIVGLKGIDRWYTAYTRSLVQAMNLMHGNLLPALDRASIEASRLRSLCRNQNIPICQIKGSSLDRILDDIDTLRALTNPCLIYARQEIPQIEAFASFLRCQFQILKEPNSTAAKEAIETFAALDHSQLLSFITGPMLKSHLNVFFGRDTSMVRNAPRRPRQFAPKRIILSMLERHSQNAMQPTSPVVEFVNLLYQSFFLADSIVNIREEAVALFEKDLVIPAPILLDEDAMSAAMDIRVCPLIEEDESSDNLHNEINPNRLATRVAGVPKTNPSELRLYEIRHESVSTYDFPSTTLDFQNSPLKRKLSLPNHEILALTFASDETLLLLLRRHNKPALLIEYPAFRRQESQTSPTDTEIENIADFTIHDFENDERNTTSERFSPMYMQTRGTKAEDGSSKQVLVLDNERIRYRVYDLA